MTMSRERIRKWCWRHRYRILGAVALIAGIAFAAWVAFLASGKTPPTGSQSGFLVVVSGLFQLASAYLFTRGAPNSEALRIQMQSHTRLATDLINARTLAEEAVDDGTAIVVKRIVGELSWRLSQAARDHDDLAANWYLLYSEMAITPEDGTNDER
ncbi:hypothetical protein FRIG_03705 [Frigoribacterium faeni]|uniref:hypothetical protein n=1 Tax=Frigoribacterium faeni TaxID=145483 RepID=UPI001FAC7DD9|nr:hypothetical protein [Frigoribacterium faeni]MCJ0700246.1 hypothetical protein [Frigoribacterium faeni]